MIVVHVTHEAVEKVGGIGAVIAGLVTADAYGKSVSRTILLGPLLSTREPVNRRLGDGGHVLYSTLDNIHTKPWRDKFHPIETTYDVGIIYGTRKVSEPCTGRSVKVEVLLVDVFHANQPRLNLFKAELYKKFAIPSDRFEKTWEFEEYVRLAEPGYEALKAIGCNGEEPLVLLAHEYMGMPTALKTILEGKTNARTVFYAHEVASVRQVTEGRQGHDLMFYNVMNQASAEGKTVESLFPETLNNFRHPLVKAARYCDHVFAVGHYTEQELHFVDPHFKTMGIDLVYNGIPAHPLTLEEKKASRARMRQYTHNLLGFQPTWVFSHVCRPVLSKALWRDLMVMESLEPLLAARGESAVYYLLATFAGQRRPQDVRHMEQVYGWPVVHEKGYPDLCQGEELIGDMVDGFNRKHTAVRAVFVNQWDWSRESCGLRMPEDMRFADIRHGTDVEFGLSIYEPFGISQLEPLCFGALCVPSNVCGCVGFARAAAEGRNYDANVLEGDFLAGGSNWPIDRLLGLTIGDRDLVERQECRRLAALIAERLPRDDQALAKAIECGRELASRMSWERVVTDYFLPSLSRATHKPA